MFLEKKDDYLGIKQKSVCTNRGGGSYEDGSTSSEMGETTSLCKKRSKFNGCFLIKLP